MTNLLISPLLLFCLRFILTDRRCLKLTLTLLIIHHQNESKKFWKAQTPYLFIIIIIITRKKKSGKNPTFLRKHVSMTLLEVSLSCLHFSLMISEREVKSPYFLQVWWALLKVIFVKKKKKKNSFENVTTDIYFHNW
jgi:GT2 family glycosyltransferase